MKVTVRVPLDVDVDAWEVAYGLSGSKEVREDVQEHVKNIVTEHLDSQGLLLRVRSTQ